MANFCDNPSDFSQRSWRFQQLIKSTDGNCWYCGAKLVSQFESKDCGVVDHVVPLHSGGSNARKNLVASCRKCNSSKSKKSVEEFRKKVLEEKCAEARAVKHLECAVMELEVAGLTDEAERLRPEINHLKINLPRVQFWGELSAIARSAKINNCQE